jgi:murein L,D-transpeptidase YafK
LKLARLSALTLVVVGLALLVTRPMIARLVISKSARTLTAHAADGSVVRRYPIALGRRPDGPKRREGDEKTPEGEYAICFKNTQSRFHLSLAINYPNRGDADRGLAEGVISPEEHRAIVEAERLGRIPPWKTMLGGEIFIHGARGEREGTAGCIALGNEDIEELFPLVALGTPVIIEP